MQVVQIFELVTYLRSGEKLIVGRAPNPVRIVRFPETTFFERMRMKLGWGGLPESDPAR